MSLNATSTLTFNTVFSSRFSFSSPSVNVQLIFGLSASIQDGFAYQDNILLAENIFVLLDGVPINFTINNGDIIFDVGNKEVTKDSLFEIRFTSFQDFDFDSFVLTDETYDKNLKFKVNARSDNNSLIRNVHVANNFYENELNLESNEQGVLGNVFNDLPLEDTVLGRPATFVHTNKLYGSGYDLEMYYKDDAKVKWTLETIGVAYKMRRTRSR